MKKNIGVCIVGCGFMGQTHAKGWAAVPEAQVVAVVDLIPKRAQTLARQLACDYYLDYSEAIARSDVNVVSVCVPTYLHAEVTIASARLGLDVLCEKPIALTLDQADQMIAASQENRVKLGLGFMRRHSKVVTDLKARLGSGEFGRPVLYHASDIRELRPKLEMHDANANGGPVIDMAVHLIDLWNIVFDSQPVSVTAYGLTVGRGRPEIALIKELAIDTASILVQYASGDIGNFVVSWGLPFKVNPPQHHDQIYTPNGLAELYYAANQQELRRMGENGVWQTLSISHQDMYQNQIRAFADWVLKDEPFPAKGSDGRLALRVALAALESIQNGQTIHL
ncbi:MAG: Gfo/Idh/MocA family protein [Anaerolineales bacterium]